MPEDDARRFRKQAEECRQQAAKATSPLDEETLLRVAGSGSGLRNPPRKDMGNDASVRSASSSVNSPTPIAWGRLAEDTADLVLF